ncbi:MAG: TonB-dependent receptor [Verrucomicrobia bacterium]|nr:TonB-dependent receptor [Cytophagales bacterium]
MKATLLAICMFLSVIGNIFSQTTGQETSRKGSIRGVVLDKLKAVAGGISISLKGTYRGTISDEKGQFEIRQLSPGNYTLVLSGITIQTVEQTVTVRAGEITLTELSISENVTELQAVEVLGKTLGKGIDRLEEVEGVSVFAGKKTEVVSPARLDANVALNTMRQVFSKVPGISIWENDYSGIQINVGSRGLSPNRSWEFNVRQNGYDISSDPMGYPEAYYNPPIEAVEQIQVIRGAAGLQFGPQFGGLLNYVLKKPDPKKPIAVESRQTLGSYGLFNSFNAVSGTKGKWSYLGYFQYRQADGWRENSRYSINNLHFQVFYTPVPRLRIGAELTQMNYIAQQSGGLTDTQFQNDPRQSFRSRNWFSTPWWLPSVSAEYTLNDKNKIQLKTFALFGERNSIGFVPAITTPDTLINGSYANRQIDRDTYRNWGFELRGLSRYFLLKREHTLAAGVRYFSGSTARRQQGKGDTDTDFNLNLQTDAFPRDLSYDNRNVAVFLENIFRITSKWSVTPGIRYESILSTGVGRLSFKTDGSPDNIFGQNQQRNFLLLGVGSEYKFSPYLTAYGNYSQAYRPVLFSDLTPPATTDVIDPDLKDAKGYNADLGFRGSVKDWLTFDVSVYTMSYENRIGTISQRNPANPVQIQQFRTNLGNTHTRGIELFAEIDLLKLVTAQKRWGSFNVFGSVSYLRARYLDFRTVNAQLIEGNLQGKKLENAPDFINRFGATYTYKGFSMTWQLNATGDVYSDASNTELPNTAATTGRLPGYRLVDVAVGYTYRKHYQLKAGINNFENLSYTTRRSGGYPGPGILPGTPRTFFVSLGVKF